MPTQDRLANAQRRMTMAYRKQRRAEALAQRQDAEAAVARTVTSLAMLAAEMSLASGASTSRSVGLVRRLVGAYDLPVHVDITYTHIALSYQPSVASDPITLIRVVQPGATDYDRLSRVEHLINRIVDEQMPLEAAVLRMQNIHDEPRHYRSWVLFAGAGLLGAAVAALLGGNTADMLVATIATILCELVRVGLSSRGLSGFFATAAAAAVPTAIGLAVMAVRPLLPPGVLLVSPSLVIAAGMVSLLAGLGVVTAAGDAIDGNYISSTARILEVVVMTGAIVVGLVLTLWLGLRVGVPAYIAPAEGFTTTPVVQLASAGLIALGYGVLCQLGPRSLVAVTVLGVLLWACYLSTELVTSSHPGRCVLSALLVGFLARALTRRLRIPVVAMVTCGVAPLMPGLMLYRAVFAMTAPDPSPVPQQADVLFLTCALTGLALAAGSSLGSTMAGTMLREAAQWRARAHRPAPLEEQAAA